MNLAQSTRFLRASSFALSAALAGVIQPHSAVAQGFPERTVTMIVPFPAGGPIDFAARLVAQKLSASLNNNWRSLT